MPRIDTKLTRLLGIRTPVVSASMAYTSGGALAAQVTMGGGFGFLGSGSDDIAKFKSEVNLARDLLKVDSQSPLPIGIGYLGWILDQLDGRGSAEDFLSVALDNNVRAVWFAYGTDLNKWIQYIRDNEHYPGGTMIFVQVTSVEEALVAINDWKVDVVVAQGVEGGGHGANSASPVLTLVSAILSVAPENSPPILAAGGLVNGGHLAALLTLGASGAVFGTRFLLSPESLYTDAQRRALLAASSSSSIRTMAFDHARGTTGWPPGIDGRALRNSTVEDFEKGVDIETLRSRYVEGVRKGDTDRIVVWAGAGVGLMNKIQPAKEIVEEIEHECIERLTSVAFLCK